jgi:sugar lactone lactonase YvrE
MPKEVSMKRQIVSVAVVALLALGVLSCAVPATADEPPAPGTLLVVVGTDLKGFSGDGGPATQAQVDSPIGLAFDTQGNLFVADHENYRVRKVTPEGIISTVAGGGNTLPPSADPIPATEAQLHPSMLTFDGAGNLFLSGFFSNRVWKVNAQGWITTLAQIQGPIGVAVDALGNLFIADEPGTRVLKMTPEGEIVTVAGGGARPPRTADGGPATEAQVDLPMGLAVDMAGNLFVAEHLSRRVRKVSPDGIISTVAGGGTKSPQLADGGPATEARLSAPFGLAVDSAGNLYISDRWDYRVRKVTPEGIISTVVGTGRPQFSGAGGPATAAGLRGPHGLAIDAAGNLYIADTAWSDDYFGRNNRPAQEHVLKVVGVAAPGLIAGRPFPKQ